MEKPPVGSLSSEQMIHLFNEDRCQQQLCVEATEASQTRAKAILHIQDWHINFEDCVHGGILFSALDSVMGMAVFPHLKVDERILAVDLKINYLTAATLDMKDLETTANLVSRTRRLAVSEGEIRSPSGDIIAKALGTFAILKQRES